MNSYDYKMLTLLDGQVQSCTQCNLHVGGRAKPYWTNRSMCGLFLEAPGKEEVIQNTPVVGAAGKKLWQELHNVGLEREDFLIVNSVNCFVSGRVKVFTVDGYKNIMDINVGDLVLTHKGRFKKVLSRTWDLPKPLRKNKEQLYYISVCRPNNPYPQSRGTTKNGIIVTAKHQFRTDNGWIYAENLKLGQNIKVLGVKCMNCGSPFYKNPSTFEKTNDFCCVPCQLNYEYESGIRNNIDITKKANIKTREMVKDGIHILQNKTKKSVKKATITRSKNVQTKNCVTNRMIIGHGEQEIGEYLSVEKIEYFSQYAISGYNYDFYLPDYNLLIEVDNPDRYGQVVKEDSDTIKTGIAIEMGISLVRISSKSPVESVRRLLKNHHGEFVFTDAEVTKIEKKSSNKRHSLYCIEVEDDNSFIAKGIVHHNCRPVIDGKNGKPTTEEIQMCSNWVRKYIRIIRPRKMLVMGKYAIDSFNSIVGGDVLPTGSIVENNGSIIFVSFFDVQVHVVVSVHPAYTIYQPEIGMKALKHSIEVFKEIGWE